jgi:hypothetical protein
MKEEKAGVVDSLVALMLFFPVTVWCAYVEKVLWWWFIVPLGMPAIGMAHAYGLSVFLWCSAGILSVSTRLQSTEKPTRAMIGIAIGFGISLLFGWIAHKLMGQP